MVHTAYSWAMIFIWARRGLGSLKSTLRSEEHTSELQSLMRISYAVFCLKKKKKKMDKSCLYNKQLADVEQPSIEMLQVLTLQLMHERYHNYSPRESPI